ncbi:MAG: hypothetical protein WC586_03720 [Methanoregula sp.]
MHCHFSDIPMGAKVRTDPVAIPDAAPDGALSWRFNYRVMEKERVPMDERPG